MQYDVIIIGAGPGGIFAAYELLQHKPDIKIAVFEAGHCADRRIRQGRWLPGRMDR